MTEEGCWKRTGKACQFEGQENVPTEEAGIRLQMHGPRGGKNEVTKQQEEELSRRCTEVDKVTASTRGYTQEEEEGLLSRCRDNKPKEAKKAPSRAPTPVPKKAPTPMQTPEVGRAGETRAEKTARQEAAYEKLQADRLREFAERVNNGRPPL